MADATDIANAYAAMYGEDPTRGRNSLLALREPMPQLAPMPDRRPSARPYLRPGDPLLGQNVNEAVAARLGDALGHRNYGEALLSAMELAVGAGFPMAKGGRRGAKGSEGPAGGPAGAGAGRVARIPLIRRLHNPV